MTMNEIRNTYKTVPNQKFGRIHKPKYKEQKVKFMYIGIEEIREATKNLSPAALKLYLYFAENENDWQFNLSPKNFQKVYDVAESTYRKAKRELIDKGYIIEKEHNCFDFYTTPYENKLSIEEIREALVEAAAKVRYYDVKTFNYYNELARKTEGMSEEEKKKEGLKILKMMRNYLLEVEEKEAKNLFNF